MALNLSRHYGRADKRDLERRMNNLFGWTTDAQGRREVADDALYGGRFSLLSGTPERSVGGGQMDAVPMKIRDAQSGQTIELDMRLLESGNKATDSGFGFGYVVGSGMYTEGGYMWGERRGEKGVKIHEYTAGEALLNRLSYAFDRSQTRSVTGQEYTAQELFFQSLTGGGTSGQNVVAGGLSFINAYDVGAQAETWAKYMAPVVLDKGIHADEFTNALSEYVRPLTPSQIHMGQTDQPAHLLSYSAKNDAVLRPEAVDAYPLIGGGESVFSLHGEKIKDKSLLRRQTVQAIGPDGNIMEPSRPGLGNNADLTWGQSSLIMPGDTGESQGLFGHTAVPRHGLITYSGGSALDPRRYQEELSGFGFESRISSRQTNPLSLADLEAMVSPGDPSGEFGLKMTDFMAEGQRRSFAPGETFTYAQIRDKEGNWSDITHTVKERPLTITENPTLSIPEGASGLLQDALMANNIRHDFRGEITAAGRQASIVLGGLQESDIALKGFGKDFPFGMNFAEGEVPESYTGQGGTATRLDMFGTWRSPEIGALRMVGSLAPEKTKQFMKGFSSHLETMNLDSTVLGNLQQATRGGDVNKMMSGFAEQGRNFIQDFYSYFNQGINDPQTNQTWLDEYGIGLLKDREMKIGRFSSSSRAMYEEKIDRAAQRSVKEGLFQSPAEARSAMGLRWEQEGQDHIAYQRDDWLVGPLVSPATPEMTGGARIGLPFLTAMTQGGFGGFAEETGLAYWLDPNNSLASTPDLRAFRHIDSTQGGTIFDQQLNNSAMVTSAQAGEMQRFMTQNLKDVKDPRKQLQMVAAEYEKTYGAGTENYTSMNFGEAGYLPDPRAILDIDHTTQSGEESISLQPTKYMNALRAAIGGLGEGDATREGQTGRAIAGFQSSWRQFTSKSDLLKRILGREPQYSMSGKYRGSSNMVNNNSVYLSNERVYAMFRNNTSIRNTRGNPMDVNWVNPETGATERTEFGVYLDWMTAQGGLPGFAGRDPNTEPGSVNAPGIMPVMFKTEALLEQEHPGLAKDKVFQKQGIMVGPGYSEWFMGDKDADPSRFFSQLTGHDPNTWRGMQDEYSLSQALRYQDPVEFSDALGRIEERRMAGMTEEERKTWHGGSTLSGGMYKHLQRRATGEDTFMPRGAVIPNSRISELVTQASGQKFQMGTAYNNFLRGTQVSAAMSGYGSQYPQNLANNASMQYQYALDAEREGAVLPEQMYQTIALHKVGDTGSELRWMSGSSDNWVTAGSPSDLRKGLIDAYTITEGMGAEFLSYAFSENPENAKEIQDMLSGIDVEGLTRTERGNKYGAALNESPLVGSNSLVQRHMMSRALSKLRTNKRGLGPDDTFFGQKLRTLSDEYDPQIEAFNLVAGAGRGDPDILARAAHIAQGTDVGHYIGSYLKGGEYATDAMRFNDFESVRTLQPYQISGGKVVDPGLGIKGRKSGEYLDSGERNLPSGVSSGSERGTYDTDPPEPPKPPSSSSSSSIGGKGVEDAVASGVRKGLEGTRVQANFQPSINTAEQANSQYMSMKAKTKGFTAEYSKTKDWLMQSLDDAQLLTQDMKDEYESREGSPDAMAEILTKVYSRANYNPQQEQALMKIMGSRRLGILGKIGGSLDTMRKKVLQSAPLVQHGVVESGTDENQLVATDDTFKEYGQNVDLGGLVSTFQKSAKERGFSEASGGIATPTQEYIAAMKKATKHLEKSSDYYEEAAKSRDSLTKQENMLGAQIEDLRAKNVEATIGLDTLKEQRAGVTDKDTQELLDFQISQAQKGISKTESRIADLQSSKTAIGGIGPGQRMAQSITDNLFGGWSMMYMQRLGSMTTKNMTRGDEEFMQQASIRRGIGTQIFGAPSSPYQDPLLARQRGKAAMGTGGLSYALGDIGERGGTLGGALLGGAVAGAATYSAATSSILGLAGMLETGGIVAAGAGAAAASTIGMVAAPIVAAGAIGVNMYGLASDPVSTMGKVVSREEGLNNFWASAGLGFAEKDELRDVLAPGIEVQDRTTPSFTGQTKDWRFAIEESDKKYSQIVKAIESGDVETAQRMMEGATSLQKQVVGGSVADIEPYKSLDEETRTLAGFRATEAGLQGVAVDHEANARAWGLAGSRGWQTIQSGMFSAGMGFAETGKVQAAFEQMYGSADEMTADDIQRLEMTQGRITGSMRRDLGYGVDDYTAFISEVDPYLSGPRGGESATGMEYAAAASRFGSSAYNARDFLTSDFLQDSWTPSQNLRYDQEMMKMGSVASAQQGLISGGAGLGTLERVQNLTEFGGLAAAQQLGSMASQRSMYGLGNEWNYFNANTVQFAGTQLGGAQQLVGLGMGASQAGAMMEHAGQYMGQRDMQALAGSIAYNPASMAMAQSQGINPFRMAQQQGVNLSPSGASFEQLQTMEVAQIDGQTGIFSQFYTQPDQGNINFQALQSSAEEAGITGSEAWQTFTQEGTRGLQLTSLKANLSNAGLASARSAVDYAFTTGVGLGGYSTIDPRSGEKFDIPAGGAWGIQERQMDLSNQQQEWNFQYQGASQAMQRSQFYENQGLQREQQIMQRNWAVEDWGYQDQTRAMQWDWKQEDFQENNRFLTGRQRKISERQMGRDTIMFNLESEQIDKSRERQEQTWDMEDKRFEMTKTHYEQQAKLQDENLEKMKDFYSESRQLQEESFELQKAKYIELHKLQANNVGAQIEAIKQMIAMLDEKNQGLALYNQQGVNAETNPPMSSMMDQDPDYWLRQDAKNPIASGDNAGEPALVSLVSEEPISVISRGNSDEQNTWNTGVMANLKAINENTKVPQQIHLKVQLPGGEFKTFVLDVVAGELAVNSSSASYPTTTWQREQVKGGTKTFGGK